MNNVIYLVQVSENKEFTKIYFNKIIAEKKEYAIQAYQVTEDINNKNTNKGYCRLLEIPFEFGFGYDGAGITIMKNF